MRSPTLTLIVSLLLVPAVSAAQEARLHLPDFTALEKKATESTDISLDGEMLNQASQFMVNSNDASAKELIQELKGIYVRSYTFDTERAYTEADLKPVRRQLSDSGWTRIVSTRDQKTGEDVGIYLRQDNGRTEGLVIIAAEPRELTIVNIVGAIDLAKLGQLRGSFGMPKLDLGSDTPLEKSMP